MCPKSTSQQIPAPAGALPCPKSHFLRRGLPEPEFFTGDDTLLCMLDRIFYKASVFMMCAPSYRGRGMDTYSVEAVPQATKQRGAHPVAP